MLQAFVLATRLFLRWFITAFLAWTIKSAFDATVSPWLERPLSYIHSRSVIARNKVRSKFEQLRLSYAEFNDNFATEVVG